MQDRLRNRAKSQTEERKLTIISHLIGVAQGKHPMSAKRSDHWPKVRAEHLKTEPVCVVCGGSEHLEVHHIHPFHLHPELELNQNNLVTLCEAGHGGVNCHLHYGHLGNFKSFNVDVVADAAEWSAKIKNRPLTEEAS